MSGKPNRFQLADSYAHIMWRKRQNVVYKLYTMANVCWGHNAHNESSL